MHRLATSAITSAVTLLIFASSAIAQTNTPTLQVVTPQEGQTIYGNKIPILFAPENFEIVDYQTNTAVKKGQGHIHLWLDDANPTRDSAVKLTSDTFTYNDVPYGNHTLRAELVNNNHASLNPPVATIINFKSAAISNPTPAPISGFDKNTALIILVVVAIVIVAAWWYTKEEDETPIKSTTPKKTARRKTSRKSRK